MRLPDFRNHDGFNRIRREMDAALRDWRPAADWTPVDLDSILRTKGKDIPADKIEIAVDGTLEYEGRKVTLYIRDQNVVYQPYKFHLSDCRTLRDMRAANRYERYVVASRNDGQFVVNSFKNGILIEKDEEQRLAVCRNCLGELRAAGIGDYSVSDFSLAEYFARFGTRIQVSKIPAHNEFTAPLNQYPTEMGEFSEEIREFLQWHCEECGVNLGAHRKFLHVHHINGQKNDNRTGNLQALCIGCHAQLPKHHHLKYKADYFEFRRLYPGGGTTHGQNAPAQ